ncbi:MAG: SOUL family heme-binding protein [Cypionkella sp.]
MSTEIPAYRVTLKEGDIEVRDYPALIAAEVTLGGDRNTAVRNGFRLLAGYIFGDNDGGRRIAMTAPVVQRGQNGTRIAMTAPVMQTRKGEDWTIQFMMPSGWSLDTLPKPGNEQVHLRPLPPSRVAAMRFSGLAREPEIRQRTEHLQAFLSRRGLIAIGEPALARYDPPWQPWFMRRNEILIDLAPS